MIDVRVSQQHEVDVARIERPGLEIAIARFAPALVHAAVHQEANTAAFDEKAGAGHLLGRTDEADSHERPPSGYMNDASSHTCLNGQAFGAHSRA